MGALDRARDLHQRARCREACAAFREADAASSLAVGDLERWAESAQLIGCQDDTIACLERAFALRADAADLAAAATDAFWLYTAYLYAGEFTLASGWLARLQSLARGLGADEPGWSRLAQGRLRIAEGRYEEACSLLSAAIADGDASGEVDLAVMARSLTARALIMSGRLDDGIPMLDDVMLRVTSDETSPRMTSIIYCQAIGTCEVEAWDLVRAQDWARHLERWMADLAVPVSGALLGHCRVYRAGLKRRRGDLAGAREDLEHAVVTLHDEHGVLVEGHAWYELGEARRMLGDHDGAEGAYRAAAALGYVVHPGLALLRLAQEKVNPALTGLRRALAEAKRPRDRAHLLPALVTSCIAARESGSDAASNLLDEARHAVVELEELAGRLGSSALDGALERARGELALADGEPEAALGHLRTAAETCRVLDHPCDTASVQVLIATACRRLGDDEAARMELESAASTFERTGARHDLDAVSKMLADADGLPGAGDGSRDDLGLTDRELDVLRLVVDGRTNKSIADELFLSERTVHRHVSSIFDKLGVHSRTQAALLAVARNLIEQDD